MAEIRVHPKADAEIWDIWGFVADHNPIAASDVVEAIYYTFGILAENPRMGTPRHFPSLGRDDIRSWPVSGFARYQVIYHPIAGGIHVILVYHSARDLASLFG